MAQDKTGCELKVGDKVHVAGYVKSVSGCENGGCTVVVETAHACVHTNTVSTFAVKDCQVEKCDHPPTPCPVNPKAAGLLLAVFTLLFGGGQVSAQVPPQAPPIVDRVAALERKVADLEARLTKAGQVSTATCPCGDSCPCAGRTGVMTTQPSAVSYSYPSYGYGQQVYGYQASPVFGSSFGSGGGGSCAGGSCSMPSSSGGFFRRR